MNTTAKDGTLAGGGEILDAIGNIKFNDNSPFLDNELISQMRMIPGIKIMIMLAIIFLMAIVILKILNIKSPFKGKGVSRELDYMEKIRKHDQSVMQANRLMLTITNIIENTPFMMNNSQKEYWQYNINRANIRIPGGSRLMKAVELHAVIMFIMLCAIAVELVVLVLVNAMLGLALIIATVLFGSTMPMTFIRASVREKDLEIKENFSDYYLMLHYVLIANANTPLAGIMKSYAKTTTSVEMQRYIDSCVHYIDTYGEYAATRYIARDFREIPEVGKLMRLIRQANEGGDIEAELMGFRTELLKARQYAIQKRMEKLVARAKASFSLLMPILFQAILSAMSIYMSDLGVATTILG